MTSHIGKGSIVNLSAILKKEQIKRALIFRGKTSYESIKFIIEKELGDIKFRYYANFSTNPKYKEIQSAINEIQEDFDIIIAVGGGSVIDFAKAYRYYQKSQVKLIAIPTTAGTGTECTQFAVVYKNGVKMSLDDKSILPEYAIVDSQFVANNPEYLKACTAMDAYCHAIESYWAVKSTDESREYAKQAIKLCKDNIVKYVNTTEEEVSEKMFRASNLAGKAINISRTTASHALSYAITSKYGIPHGHAAALSIAKLFKYNTSKGEFNELKELVSDEPLEYFSNLFKEINLEYNLQKLGINNVDEIIDNVNMERLSNNPYKLNNEDLKNLNILSLE